MSEGCVKDADVQWQIAREIPHLRRYGHALTGNRDEGDDLAQASVERALRKWHLWRRRGTLRSWLFRIEYRLYIERKRSYGARMTVQDDGAADRVAVPPRQDQVLTCQSVVAAMDDLPGEQRAALLLVALDEMPYDEAAETLDIPLGTLRSRIWRARETLRTTLAPARARLKRVK